MGYSGWSNSAYDSLRSSRIASKGVSAFSYDNDIRTGKVDKKVHENLDPKKIKGVRESRDSDKHPNSNAIAVLFDVTGSMGYIPRILQTKLPKLMSTLLVKSVIEDPQVLFGGIGDATCDTVPLQIGQFESGVEMDEDIDKIFIEGGGGGQMTESYELGLYLMGEKTSIDCYEKRGKKGYLFMIGDELAYSKVSKRLVKHFIGDSLQADISLEEILERVKEKYHVFFIIPTRAYHAKDKRLWDFWKNLLGEGVLPLDYESLVCELIVSQIAAVEGTADFDELSNSLGLKSVEKNSLSRAISTNIKNVNLSKKVKVEGDLVVSNIDVEVL